MTGAADVACSAAWALQTSPANLLTNSGFESESSGWGFYTTGKGDLKIKNGDSYECAKHAEIKITKKGRNGQLYQSGISLQGGQTYELRLAARFKRGEDVKLFMHQESAPYSNYGLNGVELDLSTEWQVFVVEFTALGDVLVNDAQLRLWLAPYEKNGTSFYFDDVVLTPKGAEVNALASSVEDVPAASVQIQGYFLDGDEEGRLAGGYTPQEGAAYCYQARPSRSVLEPADGKMIDVKLLGLGKPSSVRSRVSSRTSRLVRRRTRKSIPRASSCVVNSQKPVKGVSITLPLRPATAACRPANTRLSSACRVQMKRPWTMANVSIRPAARPRYTPDQNGHAVCRRRHQLKKGALNQGAPENAKQASRF